MFCLNCNVFKYFGHGKVIHCFKIEIFCHIAYSTDRYMQSDVLAYEALTMIFCLSFRSLHYSNCLSRLKLRSLWMRKWLHAQCIFSLQEFGVWQRFLNQHWLQDSAWNNILRNKYTTEHLSFCVIDFGNHSIETSFLLSRQQTQHYTICYSISQLNM